MVCSIWSKGLPPVAASSNVEVAPDPVTVDQIRAACKAFEPGTSVGLDGIRPRHLLLLPDAALAALALRFSELAGMLPVAGANIVFLPKPTGGERTIGVLPTLYRVWNRCRRHQAQSW